MNVVPQDNTTFSWFLIFFIIIVSLTDFFDGYSARKYNQVTPLGQVLDPVADKLWLCSLLLPLVALDIIHYYWAFIFIGREMLVMVLRLLAVEKGFDIRVSSLAKSKTALQLLYIILVLVPSNNCCIYLIKNSALTVALFASIVSAYCYVKQFIKYRAQ